MPHTDELVEGFFGAEVTSALTDPAAVARHRRQELLRVCDEEMERIQESQLKWQNHMHARFGTLGFGALVICGWNDSDWCERWAYMREQWEEATDEELLDLEFDE